MAENDPDKHQRGGRPADHGQPQAGRSHVQIHRRSRVRTPPGSDGGAAPGGDSGKKDGKDNVVDAEFVDVDDKK